MRELVTGAALLIVDVQIDFLPGGALAVTEGDQIIPIINRWIGLFEAQRLPIWATRDWHPVDHCSFQQQGGTWPPHCVQATAGACFPATMLLPRTCRIISKGRQRHKDAYSGFDGTGLHQQLQAAAVSRVYVAGLATDYCVRATVLDSLHLGLRTVVLHDAIRAVNLRSGDAARALDEMQAAGAEIFTQGQMDGDRVG